MSKWRIHKENGKYIPQRKWLCFWIDIVLLHETYNKIKNKGYKFLITEHFDSYGDVSHWYRPEFETMEGAIYCIKEYDEYCKKKEDDEKIEDYYLDENYEVKPVISHK